MTFDQQTKIEFIIFDPTQPIALQDVIKKYGPPSSLVIYQEGLPEKPIGWAVLLYNAILTNLYLAQQDGPTYRLEGATRIEQVAYFAPHSYAAEVQAMCCKLQEWRGYGVYP